MKKKFIGIDIGGTKCSVVLGDEQANIQNKMKIETEDYETTIRNLMDLTEKMMVPGTEAIGISCGGPLDSQRGIILSPPNLRGWDEIPIVAMFRERFGIPVFLQNDADACTVAEWKFGAGKGCSNVVFLTFGTGMGAGLVLNGKLYSGTCDMAGEIGHVRIRRSGHIGYGKKGAFEGYCSGSGIAQYGMGSAKEVAELAMAGNPEAIEIFAKVGRDLGKGLSILVDILNPEVIIIGSIYTRLQALMEPYMMQVVQKETIPQNFESVRIVPSQLGERLGDVAALEVAIHRSEMELDQQIRSAG